ncbi:MAG: GPP34 family phosphoprotein, partial [Candidatus Heimdallarchaeota archaeon]|nr:GPP34 family phosphoprotein [Candidatus Heimdallarchaeota archaeon]
QVEYIITSDFMELTLPETYLLCNIDKKGNLGSNSKPYIELALVGSCLMQLCLQGRLAEINNILIIIDETELEDDILNDIFLLIKSHNKDESATYWMDTIANTFPNLVTIYLEKLVNQNKIELFKSKFLGVFNIIKYAITNEDSLNNIRTHLYELIKGDKEAPPQLIALLCLLNASKQLNNIIDQKDISSYKTCIEGLTMTNGISKSMMNLVDNIFEAIMRNYMLTFTYSY